jgi:hypothetical protein
MGARARICGGRKDYGLRGPSERSNWARRFFGDLANESIAALRDCLNILRRLCVVAQRGANLPDGGVKPLVEIDERIAAPDLALNLLPGKYLVRVGGHQDEHLARLRSEVK